MPAIRLYLVRRCGRILVSTVMSFWRGSYLSELRNMVTTILDDLGQWAFSLSHSGEGKAQRTSRYLKVSASREP